MDVVSVPEATVPTELKVQVHTLQERAWPSWRGADIPADQPIHDPALRPVSMVLVDDGRVRAALDILHKEIAHAGRSWKAGGLSTVVAREEDRGRGYGRMLVAAAREAMAAEGLDNGLFTCDRYLQGFYERAGWRVLSRSALIGGTPDAPFPSDQPGFDKVTMAEFFTVEAKQAAAAFENSRIELYPGAIDKLW